VRVGSELGLGARVIPAIEDRVRVKFRGVGLRV
jgi:hypothetical protein